MRIICFTIVVDDCSLSPEEFYTSLKASYLPSAEFWTKVNVKQGYYPKERHVVTEDRRYLPNILNAIDNLLNRLGKE